MKWTKDTPRESAIEYRDIFRKSIVGRYTDASEKNAVLTSMNINKDIFLLDAGCGTGRFLAYTAPGQKFVGMDISPEMLEVAREELQRGSFVVGELEHLPFEDAVFDEVICVRVLQHIKDQERAVRELARVCKANGHVIVLCYNSWTFLCLYKKFRMSKLARLVNYPFGLLLREKSMFSKWPFDYDNYCSMPELCRLFDKAGLAVEEKKGATIGFPWMFYEQFNPRILEYYFRICTFIEKRFTSEFPFYYFMDKVVVKGRKR